MTAALAAICGMTNAQETTNGQQLIRVFYGTKAGQGPYNPCAGKTTRICGIVATDKYVDNDGVEHMSITVTDPKGNNVGTWRYWNNILTGVDQGPAWGYFKVPPTDLEISDDVERTEAWIDLTE